MQEADILAETYWDTVTVYRPFKDTLPSGESVFKSGTGREDDVSGCSMCAIFPQRRSVGPEQLHGICRYFIQPFCKAGDRHPGK